MATQETSTGTPPPQLSDVTPAVTAPPQTLVDIPGRGMGNLVVGDAIQVKYDMTLQNRVIKLTQFNQDLQGAKKLEIVNFACAGCGACWSFYFYWFGLSMTVEFVVISTVLTAVFQLPSFIMFILVGIDLNKIKNLAIKEKDNVNTGDLISYKSLLNKDTKLNLKFAPLKSRASVELVQGMEQAHVENNTEDGYGYSMLQKLNIKCIIGIILTCISFVLYVGWFFAQWGFSFIIVYIFVLFAWHAWLTYIGWILVFGVTLAKSKQYVKQMEKICEICLPELETTTTTEPKPETV